MRQVEIIKQINSYTNNNKFKKEDIIMITYMNVVDIYK